MPTTRTSLALVLVACGMALGPGPARATPRDPQRPLFSGWLEYPVGGGISTAIGSDDFDADGVPDLAVASASASTGEFEGVTILRGDASGQFEELGRYPQASGAERFLAIADFDRDGASDLAVSDWSGPISVLPGRGDGTFGAAVYSDTGGPLWCMAAGDFNGDGIPDLAVADVALGVLPGRGDGSFGLPVWSAPGYGYMNLAVADVDRDGQLDVAAIAIEQSSGIPGVAILRGNGDGAFLTPLFYAGFSMESGLAVADLDGDGIPDLAAASYDQDALLVLFGNGDGTFRPGGGYEVPPFQLPVSVAVGHFDSDGYPDLVAGSRFELLSVYRGSAAGTFEGPTVVLGPPDSQHTAVADFDGDGKDDLASTGGQWGDDQGGRVFVTHASEAGGFQSAQILQLSPSVHPSAFATADLDLDGNLDLVASDSYFEEVRVLLGHGDATFEEQPALAVGSGPRPLVLRDFDGNGAPDLAVANEWSDDVSVLLGSGYGTFPVRTDYGVGAAPASIVAEDFDADGTTDLVTANYGSGSLSILTGDAAGQFHESVSVPLGSGTCPTSVAAGDADGDGHADLAVATPCNEAVLMLLGRGDGAFAAPVPHSFAGRGFPAALALADFDADGYPDLAVGGNFDTWPRTGFLSILRGVGAGEFEEVVRYDNLYGPVDIASADFDGDGLLDLAAAEAADSVVVLFGAGDGRFPAAHRYLSGSWQSSLAVGDYDGDGDPDLAVAPGPDDGWYSLLLLNLALSPPPCLHHGDVTANGAITAGDAQLAFLIALGVYTPVQTQACAADCNGNGAVTAGDAQTIFAATLGLAQCADAL